MTDILEIAIRTSEGEKTITVRMKRELYEMLFTEGMPQKASGSMILKERDVEIMWNRIRGSAGRGASYHEIADDMNLLNASVAANAVFRVMRFLDQIKGKDIIVRLADGQWRHNI